jgi:uncharacterized protein Usg
MLVLRKKILTTVNVLYYRPQYNTLIQEFIWQTMDRQPHYPRIHKFLNFWHKEINTVIKEVIIMNSESSQIRHVRDLSWLK